MNLNELTLKQAAEGIRQKQFSVTELVSDCLNAAKEKDPEINAYLEIFTEALKEAKKADEMLAGSDPQELPPLFGIPVAVKDNILIEGRRASAGSKMLDNYIAAYDATVIRKLKNQGAIFLGKTNLDEFAMGSSTEFSAFGPTKNPHDLSRVPGGSSGGSAAAVAADMAIAALGSDTGGSIRQPAAFCGIVGMKPTYGSVSRHGLIAMASSLDQIGPMAKTVEDARILYEAIAGEDAFDATATRTKHEAPHQSKYGTGQARSTKHGLNNLKIGIPKEYFVAGLDPEIETLIKAALKKVETAGAKIEEISLPHSEYALPCYYIIVPSEISANLARYDGIRYGFAVTAEKHGPAESRIYGENLHDVYVKSRALGLGPEVKRRIMLGTYALSAGYYEAYYLKAQKVRRLIRRDFENAFAKVDVIAGPATPTPAFRTGERMDDPLRMYLADTYTVAVNLAGLPALSLPAESASEQNSRLPIGLQLIGKRFQDEALFGAAQEIENILNYAQQ